MNGIIYAYTTVEIMPNGITLPPYRPGGAKDVPATGNKL